VEIINVLTAKGIDFNLIESSQEVLVINTPVEFDSWLDIDDFGSTVKIIKVLKEFSLSDLFNGDPAKFLGRDFGYLTSVDKEKIFFALSVYGAGCRFKDLNQSWYLAPKIAIYIRENLMEQGIKAAFLPLNERRVSSVMLDKNKILRDGFEIVLAIGRETVYFGKTISIQDYKNYSFRDYGRPNRDVVSGMIPPKVAKMMINLANRASDEIILDPFCGSGTIVTESVLLGYKNIIGTDLSSQAIEDTKANVEWIFKNYPELIKEKYDIKLSVADVKNLSTIIPQKNINAIVSEPFLGSEKSRNFSDQQMKGEIKKLERLYLSAFNEFSRVLNKFGTVVIIFPVFLHRHVFHFLDILPSLKKIGWNQKSYLPARFQDGENLARLNLELTPRGSIVYFRPDQTVSREILVFSKNAS